MYKDILIPIDTSPCQNAIIKEALGLALIHGASVSFLHVIEDPTMEIYGRTYGSDMYNEFVKAADETLDEALKRAQAANIPAKTILIDKEHPADAILKAEEDHDLIVMGTHGRTGIRRMMLGSITEEVMRRSKKPHLIVYCDVGS